MMRHNLHMRSINLEFKQKQSLNSFEALAPIVTASSPRVKYAPRNLVVRKTF